MTTESEINKMAIQWQQAYLDKCGEVDRNHIAHSKSCQLLTQELLVMIKENQRLQAIIDKQREEVIQANNGKGIWERIAKFSEDDAKTKKVALEKIIELCSGYYAQQEILYTAKEALALAITATDNEKRSQTVKNDSETVRSVKNDREQPL